MRPKDIEKLLETMCDYEVPHGKRKETVMIIGPPGCGKTQIALQVAKRKNLFLVFFHPLFSEPIDLTGCPWVSQNGTPAGAKTWWANPNWIPDEVPEGYTGIMVLVDEMSQCDPPMMKACAPICEEHRIGTKILPHGSIVIATGNRAGDRAGAAKLLSHVKSRIIEIPFESSVEDFVEWGTVDNRIIPQVRYFVTFKSNCLNTFDPAAEGQYASQRGWEKVSNLYPVIPESLRNETMSGIVGKGPAAEFLGFSQIWEMIHETFNLDNILKSPEKSPVPKKDQLDICFALAGSLAEKVKAMDGIKPITQAMIYLKRIAREAGFIGVQAICTHCGLERFQQVCRHPMYLEWFKDNQELLNEARMINQGK